MKLLFKRKNNVSFLSEIGRQKRVVSVNVDKYTFEPNGKSFETWNSDEVDDKEWSLFCHLSDDYIIEFAFKKGESCERILEPTKFILWGGTDCSAIIDEGLFDVVCR